jgi:hypothetical protein
MIVNLVKRVVLLLGMFTLILGTCSQRVAAAETINAMLDNACPAAQAAARKADRAHALVESDQYELAKQEAGLFYDCYQQLSDPYARDWAELSYLYALFASDSNTTMEIGSLLKARSRLLYQQTSFPDVRKDALGLFTTVNTIYDPAYDALRHPGTSPSPLPRR